MLLDTLTIRQWKEQIAFDDLDEDRIGRLAEILKRGFAALCQLKGEDVSPDYFEPMRSLRAKVNDGYTPPNEQVAALLPQMHSTRA